MTVDIEDYLQKYMARYYGAMAGTIENLGDNTEQLSIRIRHMLQDNLDGNPIRTIFRDV